MENTQTRIININNLQPFSLKFKRLKQTTFEAIVEMVTYAAFVAEILVIAYVILSAMDYFTMEDDETIPLITVGVIHIGFFIAVSIFQVLLIQYLQDNDSVTLKEFDKVSTAMLTWVVEQLFYLIFTAFITYYIIYVVEYYPAYDDIIRILLFMLGKFMLILIHYSMFLRIKHQHDPTLFYLIPAEQI